jgi:two-component system, LuxR family, response regulator FixJ
MSLIRQIHIVDRDARRRAQLAFKLNGSGYRAHVYEDIRELERFEPAQGLVLLSGDDDPLALVILRDKQVARGISIPIAMYSSEPKPPMVVEAILSGAVDYLQWPFTDESVLDQVTNRAVQMQKLDQRRISARKLINTLSGREREVLIGMVTGKSNKAVANELNISPRTVEIHRSNVIRKLHVESSAGAVRLGIYAGLDTEDLSSTG